MLKQRMGYNDPSGYLSFTFYSFECFFVNLVKYNKKYNKNDHALYSGDEPYVMRNVQQLLHCWKMLSNNSKFYMVLEKNTLLLSVLHIK